MTEVYPGEFAFERDLANYMAGRERERRTHSAAIWNGLSDRDRALVREAAVMGFVQGSLSGRDQMPRDMEILHRVITGCRANEDLYPLLGAEPNTMGASPETPAAPGPES